MGLAELARNLELRLGLELGAGRAEHSRSVARLAGELCSRWGLDPDRGIVAGLAHDLCKRLPLARQKELAGTYEESSGLRFELDEVVGAAAVHGPAAAGLLILEYGCEEVDILEAVALHTLGAREMGDLARIVYAADKLEPGRAHVDPSFRERCLLLPPDELFFAVLRDTVEWLRSQGLPVAEVSLSLRDSAALREIDA